MSETKLKIEKKDDILVYDIPEVVKYLNDNMLPEIMDLALNHYLEGFPTSNTELGGGRTNISTNGWVKRQEDYNHPALVKSGRLKNSLKIEGDSIVSETAYGEYHNDGVDGRLPQREFLGESDELENKIVKFIEDKLEALILK